MNAYLKQRYVWWRKVMCFFGSHRLSDDWGLKWSDKSSFTHCEYCNKNITEWDWWAINTDWLRGKFRVAPKYDVNPFWKWLTPKATRLILIDHRDEVVARLEPKNLETSLEFTEFIKVLNRSHYVEVRRKSWFGKLVDEELDSLQVLLLIATAENK